MWVRGNEKLNCGTKCTKFAYSFEIAFASSLALDS
jgi:hypothetical protein